MACAEFELLTSNFVMQQVPPIFRASGATLSERYLKQLCDRSFLSLWSYLGIYRDQGQPGKKGDGKEVCDLLVVFQDHIIIFSDKDCDFPNTGDLQIDWSRWFRKAILKSADQIWGAERWIKSFPDRLFLDPSCTQKFPIELPDLQKAHFHRILVAHKASQRCQEELGGSGSLMIFPDISGSQHLKSDNADCRPFMVGQIDPAKGFVHIFDDTSLDITLKTLDTITDFVSYLTKKEAFIQSGLLGVAAGEEDLLAFYLMKSNEFVVPPESNKVFIDQGHWEVFSQSSQRKRQIQANKISYSWDTLLEKFFHHFYNGTSLKLSDSTLAEKLSDSTLAEKEKWFRLFARENRTRRRLLADGIYNLIAKTPVSESGTRVVAPSNPGDPYYVFLLLPNADFESYEKYREVRLAMLEAYCRVVKFKFPDATDILGIATETGNGVERSEDALYIDGRHWDDNAQEDARKFHEEIGLLKDTTESRGRVKDYPDSNPKPIELSANVKGRNRNALCFCGSRRKYKKCCGRKNT